MRLVNQRMITLNLALAEMMNSFSQVAFSSRFLHGHKDFFCLFLTIVAVVANKLIMIYLIVDRFLDIHFHMQYPLYFTKEKISKVLMSLWVVSLATALILTLLARFVYSFLVINSFVIYIYFIMDLIITAAALVAYFYLYLTISRSNRKLQRNGNKKERILSKFTVPFLIIASYLVFNVTGMALIMVVFIDRTHHMKMTLHSFGIYLIALGIISDAFIYVFLQKDIRNGLRKVLQPFTYNRKPKASMDTTETGINLELNRDSIYRDAWLHDDL